jgi:hypothetical protein
MIFPGFAGPTYALASLAADAQRAINIYPEIVESGTGKAKLYYRATPGLAAWGTLPTAPVRGLWAGSGILYAVGGSKLYSVSSGGTPTLRGDVTDDATHSPVQFFPNSAGTELFIVSAGQAFVDTGTGPVSAPVPADDRVDAAFPAGQVGTASTAAQLDGFFIAAKFDSNRFFLSALNDATSWDALDFAQKEGYPDNIARVIADHEELWLMGDETLEAWRNEGAADFPFRRDPGAFIHQGCIARFSAVNLIDGPAWLAGDTRGRAVAVRAQGFQPVRCSTHAIEQAWATYSTVADAIGYTYTDGGHHFWVLTFPTANATWVFDLSTGMWHERAYGPSLDRHRGRCHAFCYEKHLVGDHTTGVIYRMEPGLYSDAGTDIRRVRTAPHLAEENVLIVHHRLQIEIDDMPGNHTAVTVDWSNNGGSTWSSAHTASTSSALPNKLRRLIWRRLGVARDRVYRVTFTQQYPLSVINAYLELSPGNA